MTPAELDEIERLAAEAMAGDPFALVEAVARLCAMRDDPGMTWDLSDNDQAALRLVLEAYGAGNAARTAVPALVAALREAWAEEAECGAALEGHVCTEPHGHEGVHIAADGWDWWLGAEAELMDLRADLAESDRVEREKDALQRATQIERDAALAQVERMRAAGDAVVEKLRGLYTQRQYAENDAIAAWKAAR